MLTLFMGFAIFAIIVQWLKYFAICLLVIFVLRVIGLISEELFLNLFVASIIIALVLVFAIDFS